MLKWNFVYRFKRRLFLIQSVIYVLLNIFVLQVLMNVRVIYVMDIGV